MANIDSTGPSPPAQNSSYADYLETKQKHGSPHYWLIKFLREGWDKPVDFKSEQSYMDIHIIDSIHGTLEDQSFKILSGDLDTPTFLAVLKARPANVKTRLILVQARQLGSINRAYIDALASHFKIDPYFLAAYLQLCLRSSRNINLATSHLPVLLPSERTFLQLVQDDRSHLTAAITNKRGGNTIIVLGMDLFYPQRVTTLRDHLLSQYSETDILAADEMLPEYLFPYIQDSARHAAQDCNFYSGHGSATSSAALNPAFDGRLWHSNQINYQRLIDSTSSITKFIADPKTGKQPNFTKWQTLLDDYATIIKETEVIGSVLQGRLQQSTSFQVMEETKRGLRVANSVRRLTVVAFILNSATSFFGMNVKQLGTGTIHLGYFFLLAALGGFLVYIVSAAIMPIEAAWLEAKRRYDNREWEDNRGVAHDTKLNHF